MMTKKAPRKRSWISFTEKFVKEWPDVFDTIEYVNLPISYLKFAKIFLKNHVSIIYDVEKELSNKRSQQAIATQLKSFIDKNSNKITNIELKFDTDRMKRDMQNKTNSLMNKTFKK
jgi:hypothetical protein